MVAHIAQHHRRQDSDPLLAPTGNGFTGAVTINTDAQATTLAIDGTANGAKPTEPAPPFQVTVPAAPSTSSGPTDTPSPTSDASTGVTKSVIPMSTVVGACLGALAGAILLILLGLWFYKRSEPKRRARRPLSLSASRNVKGDLARSRAGMETWKKLGDNEDKWEAKYQTKEVTPMETVGPMEKLTMFKSPSIRTAYTHRSEEHPHFDLEPHPFSTYHPGLAKDMASNNIDHAEPEEKPAPARQFLGRVDVGPALSWDSHGSFLSLQSRMSGSMSPTPAVLKSTPGVTSSEPHVWESAEVLEFNEVADAHSNNPFNDLSERRMSGNPFFNAQGSPAPVTKSVQSVVPTIITPKIDKGKARDMTGSDADPFLDENAANNTLHVDAESTAPSISSSDRALQSLIAALDITPADVQERLRIASMQPSIISNASALSYTSGVEEDVTDAFPSPPGQSFNKP